MMHVLSMMTGRVNYMCRLCQASRTCSNLEFSFSNLEGEYWRVGVEEFLACDGCRRRIERMIFDDDLRSFFEAVFLAAIEHGVWKCNYERQQAAEKSGVEEFGPRAAEWAEAITRVFHMLARAGVQDRDQFGVAEVLHKLTGLHRQQCQQFVSKVFEEERAKLPPAERAVTPMAIGQEIAGQLVSMLGANAVAHKIGIIRIVLKGTGLGLREAKTVVEAALANRQPTNGTHVTVN